MTGSNDKNTMSIHEKYRNEFKAYARKVTSTKASALVTYQKAGILTETGRLKRNYYHKI